MATAIEEVEILADLVVGWWMCEIKEEGYLGGRGVRGLTSTSSNPRRR